MAPGPESSSGEHPSLFAGDALPTLAATIEAHGLATKKSLGQHFLTDPNLLRKIVRGAGRLDGVHVIEVGPGPGGLTRALVESEATHITAIEKDARCIAALQPLQQVAQGRLTILEADALRMDIGTIGAAPRVVVANLPYNVGTQLVVDWVRAVAMHGTDVLRSMTVLLQKEVAQRMVAQVGDAAYGRLSVLMRQYCEAAILFDISPGAFSPPPKVMSSLLQARFLAEPREAVALEALEKTVAAAFNQRRKMLRQSLKPLGGEALCQRAGIDPTLRAEQCALAMFAALARAAFA